MIFIQSNSPFKEETLIIEEDTMSIWAYLLNDSNEIIQYGLLCSTGELIEEQSQIKTAIDNGLAPPLLRDFENDYSIQIGLAKDDLDVEWVSGEELIIYLKSVPYLKMNMVSKESYSMAVNQDGPYGKKWK